jgi:hypothetical protein
VQRKSAEFRVPLPAQAPLSHSETLGVTSSTVDTSIGWMKASPPSQKNASVDPGSRLSPIPGGTRWSVPDR